MPAEYPSIGSYAIIGNGRTVALVGRDGSIDWCCWPRFDGPAAFCRMLDVHRGGFFRVAPVDDYRVSREYAGPTNVLQTTFRTESGAIRLTDLMPAPSMNGGERTFPHRILRCVEGLLGEVPVEIVFRPTFDYASTPAQLETTSNGVIATGSDQALTLVAPIRMNVSDDVASARETIRAGERLWISLTHGPAESAEADRPIYEEDAARECERTIDYWTRWTETCTYEGPYRSLVIRSALLLKLLIFEPTGGWVAAPTLGLPVDLGGVRNWDYRYTWLRDATLAVDALASLGYRQESATFVDWLRRLWVPGEELELHPLYRIDGSPAPDERALPDLEGYRGSRPVYVGNQAVRQRQADVFGHVVDAATLHYEQSSSRIDDDHWTFLRALADCAAAQWREPDHGPWELPGPAKHYVYSKLYCWVALDRIVKFTEDRSLPGDLERWRSERDAVRDSILENGYRETVGAFTMAYDTDDLDASLLTMRMVGFLPSDDARIVSTVRAIQESLVSDGLVYRYHVPGAMPGKDATFTLCSFWLVINLALAGNVSEARELFDRICSYANDLGLLSEEIDPDHGMLLGNFPQAFAHLGLIRAALHIRDAESR
jgi:GH15 family glucan-1,4-alpha-glucosidase